jgi:hypothetical protein
MRSPELLRAKPGWKTTIKSEQGSLTSFAFAAAVEDWQSTEVRERTVDAFVARELTLPWGIPAVLSLIFFEGLALSLSADAVDVAEFPLFELFELFEEPPLFPVEAPFELAEEFPPAFEFAFPPALPLFEPAGFP